MSGIPAGAGSLLGKQLGKYEILALLALGGTAEIYLARIGGAAGFEKYVVVKCLHDHLNDDQDFVKMFLDEARIAAQLDHSNIVQTTELGEHDSRYYMVMEFLAGLSLAMIVRRAGERIPGGKIPVPLSLNMLAQSCAGLHYAHERTVNGKNLNIVHRDISPQNLVVSFEGVVKVVDFGIAKADQRETKTRTGTIKGKFAYMSPEQCVAQNVDRRTDVFALGVIAHELLTGKRLFKRPSPYETYQAVIDCAVPPPSQVNHELDPVLDGVIMKALAKDKESRYATAEAFGDALAGYLHSRGKGSGPGDVARFFDASFAVEIEEHGARMRDLISGRDSMDVGMGWGDEEEEKAAKDKEAKKRRETVDLTPAAAAAALRSGGGKAASDGDKSMELGTQDLIMRPSAGSLSDVIDDLGVKSGDHSYDSAFDDSDDGDGDEDEDGMPAEKTRIESNPLELLQEHLEKQKAPAPAAAAPAPAPRPTPKPIAVPSVLPAKQMPNIPKGPLSGSKPITGPAPVVRATPPGGQVAQGNPLQPKLPPSGPLPLPPVPPSASAVSVGGGKFLEPAQLPTMIADLDESSNTGSGPVREKTPAPQRPPTASGFDEAPATQMESASFDGETFMAPNNQQQQQPPPQQQQQMQPSMQSPAQGYPQQQQQPQQQMPFQNYNSPPQGYPQQQSQGYPQQHSQGYPQQQIDSGVFINTGQQAQLASPVGSQYPQQVDWEAAAARPAKALPSWLMGAIFVGAIGLALTLTIVIAKLVSHHH